MRRPPNALDARLIRSQNPCPPRLRRSRLRPSRTMHPICTLVRPLPRAVPHLPGIGSRPHCRCVCRPSSPLPCSAPPCTPTRKPRRPRQPPCPAGIGRHPGRSRPQVGPYKPIYSWFGYDELNYTTTPNGRKLLRELHDLSPSPSTSVPTTCSPPATALPASSGPPPTSSRSTPPASPSTTSPSSTRSSTPTATPASAPWSSSASCPKTSPPAPAPTRSPTPRPSTAPSRARPRTTPSGASSSSVHRASRPALRPAEVATWYFEVWNEPDISYWHGTPERVLQALRLLRRRRPQSPPQRQRRRPRLHRPRLPARHRPSSPTSSTTAPTTRPPPTASPSHSTSSPSTPRAARSSSPPAGATAHVRMGLSNELSAAANGFRIVAASASSTTLPIILSEADPEGCAACSARENPANAYRNGPLYPAYTAAAMKALFDLAATNTASTSSACSPGPSSSRARTTSRASAPSPPTASTSPSSTSSAWPACSPATASPPPAARTVPADDHLKSGVRAQPDIDAFATKSAHEASVMLWNYHDDDLPASGSQVTGHVAGIPAGVHKVLLEHYRIDQTHSNAFTVWQSPRLASSPPPPRAVRPAQGRRPAPNPHLARVARRNSGPAAKALHQPPAPGHRTAPRRMVIANSISTAQANQPSPISSRCRP